jgi:NTE family protein
MFAAWEAGVWKALAGHIQPDLIVGASAGAWNGWVVAGGASPDELIQDWLDGSLAEITIFHGARLRAKARELAERRPAMPFGLTVVEARTLRPRLICNSEIEWAHLAATCAIPGVFPAMRINGRYYLDGGLVGALPLWAAEEMGANCAIGINCLNGPFFRMLRAGLPVREPTAKLRVTELAPSRRLGSLKDALYWSHRNVERWIGLGEADGKRALSSITI